MSVTTLPVGDHLRAWRRRRRMSQLDLAGEAEVSWATKFGRYAIEGPIGEGGMAEVCRARVLEGRYAEGSTVTVDEKDGAVVLV